MHTWAFEFASPLSHFVALNSPSVDFVPLIEQVFHTKHSMMISSLMQRTIETVVTIVAKILAEIIT